MSSAYLAPVELPEFGVPLRSGMALQCDIIPATGGDYFTTNIEDGLALAGESLRDELAERDPQLWRRVLARRAFMRDALGIELHADVLPLSNIPGWLPPFLLDTSRDDDEVDCLRDRAGGPSGALLVPRWSPHRAACPG